MNDNIEGLAPMSELILLNNKLGDGFSHSLYIDAVKQEMAPTSRDLDTERVSMQEYTIDEYFQAKRKP